MATKLNPSSTGVAKTHSKSYPGEIATPKQLRELADEYRKAAHALLPLGRPRAPLSRAPFRLSALHAIELYLNALLIARGSSHEEIRGMQHNLALRAEHAIASGLSLRKNTLTHLKNVHHSREYLVTRYEPEFVETVSQINRLTATLDEVAKKVASALEVRTGNSKSTR